MSKPITIAGLITKWQVEAKRLKAHARRRQGEFSKEDSAKASEHGRVLRECAQALRESAQCDPWWLNEKAGVLPAEKDGVASRRGGWDEDEPVV